MLPELLYGGITACAGSIGLGLGIYFTPWKRVAKICRSYLPRARRMARIDTDMAMHLSLEVDLEWWQARFDALVEKTTPQAPFAGLLEWSTAIQDEIQRLGALATEEEFKRKQQESLRSVTEGDVTYSFNHLTNVEPPTVAELGAAVAAGVISPGEARWVVAPRGETGPVHPSIADARPPGLPSVREAQEAGVDLVIARKRIAEAFANHPGASSIPRDESVALRAYLDASGNWDRLVDAVRQVNEAIDEHYECPDCAYVDVRTWADAESKCIKGRKCPECQARELAGKVAHWS